MYTHKFSIIYLTVINIIILQQQTKICLSPNHCFILGNSSCVKSTVTRHIQNYLDMTFYEQILYVYVLVRFFSLEMIPMFIVYQDTTRVVKEVHFAKNNI